MILRPHAPRRPDEWPQAFQRALEALRHPNGRVPLSLQLQPSTSLLRLRSQRPLILLRQVCGARRVSTGGVCSSQTAARLSSGVVFRSNIQLSAPHGAAHRQPGTLVRPQKVRYSLVGSWAELQPRICIYMHPRARYVPQPPCSVRYASDPLRFTTRASCRGGARHSLSHSRKQRKITNRTSH